jgi:hypothetical protein
MHFNTKTPAETTEVQDTADISDIGNTSSIEHKDGSEIEKNLPTPDQSSEDDKLSGIKLLVLGFALCFMVFLIALNGTVVATVRLSFLSRSE